MSHPQPAARKVREMKGEGELQALSALKQDVRSAIHRNTHMSKQANE